LIFVLFGANLSGMVLKVDFQKELSFLIF